MLWILKHAIVHHTSYRALAFVHFYTSTKTTMLLRTCFRAACTAFLFITTLHIRHSMKLQPDLRDTQVVTP
jgi:hypothetical protein